MIRINLLPVREAQRRASGFQQLIVFAVLLVLEAGVLVYLSTEKSAELAKVVDKNRKLETTVAAIEAKVSKADKQREMEEKLKKQTEVLDQLVAGQTGPVKMLEELALILTPIEDPVQKVAMKQRGWNSDWDPTRLWIDTFVEDMREVNLKGKSRSNDDLAEFLKRLNTSRHFHDIRLNISEVVEFGDVRVVGFDIDAFVLYGKADEAKLTSRGPEKKKKKK